MGSKLAAPNANENTLSTPTDSSPSQISIKCTKHLIQVDKTHSLPLKFDSLQADELEEKNIIHPQLPNKHPLKINTPNR